MIDMSASILVNGAALAAAAAAFPSPTLRSPAAGWQPVNGAAAAATGSRTAAGRQRRRPFAPFPSLPGSRTAAGQRGGGGGGAPPLSGSRTAALAAAAAALRSPAAGRQPEPGGGGAPSLPTLRSPAAGGQPVNGTAVVRCNESFSFQCDSTA
jgi:hypothetical protein